jgi:hypothetical protein
VAKYICKDKDTGREFAVDDFRITKCGEIEYIEPYTHNVKTINGEFVRDALGPERGILWGLSQGPRFSNR